MLAQAPAQLVLRDLGLRDGMGCRARRGRAAPIPQRDLEGEAFIWMAYSPLGRFGDQPPQLPCARARREPALQALGAERRVRPDPGEAALGRAHPVPGADVARLEVRAHADELLYAREQARGVALQLLGEDHEQLLAREHLEIAGEDAAVLAPRDIAGVLPRVPARTVEHLGPQQLGDRLLPRALLLALHRAHAKV